MTIGVRHRPRLSLCTAHPQLPVTLLLQALRGRRRPVTAAVLAGMLEVSERTIYRDVAELVSQGAPIEGESGVGYILRPGLFLPPLMLNNDEIEAIGLGVRYVNQRGDGVLTSAAASALAKIASILSPDAQEALTAPVALAGPSHNDFPDNAVPLSRLREAIRRQTRLHIVYIDRERRRSERTVWPIQLGFMDLARVLVAWCEMRQAFRFFRTDRLASAVDGDWTRSACLLPGVANASSDARVCA